MTRLRADTWQARAKLLLAQGMLTWRRSRSLKRGQDQVHFSVFSIQNDIYNIMNAKNIKTGQISNVTLFTVIFSYFRKLHILLDI